MLILRLKQCEVCLSGGRLDEAFELARQPDVRSHRRGQEILNRLTRSLVARGNKHLTAGQVEQAKADCDKASLLGGNLPDISQLQSAIGQVMAERAEANRKNMAALVAARHHAMQGQLTVGQQILAAVAEPDGRIDGLKADLAGRRTALESSVAKSALALQAGDWEAAIDHLLPLARGNAQDAKLRELCGKISGLVIEQSGHAIESGRLDQSGAMVAALDRLPAQSTKLESHRTTLEQCKAAHDAIEAADPQAAQEILTRLAAMWPKAKWLATAAGQAREMAETISAMRSSPLALAALSNQKATPARGGMPMAFANLNVPPALPRFGSPRAGSPGAGSPMRIDKRNESFCMHVDGIGSFQVFTGPAISIGPISGSRSVDLALMLDPGAPAITISRSDEDYFLKSSRPVQVNDGPVTSKLLCNGDRISLGSRCRITFRRPSAASSSAVLDLSGTRTSDSSIRQVVLLDRELIMGPGPNAHIRADDLSAPVVIQRRGDAIVGRCAAEISIDGQPSGKTADILPGAHVAIGPVRFVIAREEVA